MYNRLIILIRYLNGKKPRRKISQPVWNYDKKLYILQNR